jgi:hypothetical protein
MGHPVVVNKDTWKKKRDDLSNKRNLLFKKYTRNPQDFSLAREIKAIDDEIAEYTSKMTDDTRAERKSRRAAIDSSRN